MAEATRPRTAIQGMAGIAIIPLVIVGTAVRRLVSGELSALETWLLVLAVCAGVVVVALQLRWGLRRWRSREAEVGG